MADQEYDLAVIGAGPGGYVAAIRAAQLGLRTACIEKGAALGGTCLNIGCIPSKALLDSSELYHTIHSRAQAHGISVDGVSLNLDEMMRRKQKVVTGLTKGVEFLFRKNNITWIRGTAAFDSPTEMVVTAEDGSSSTVSARSIIVATGSEPVPFPGVPFDEDRVLSSTGALALTEVPKRLVVVGGGVIAMELGSVWLRLGAQVTVLEMLPTILPGADEEVVAAAARSFQKQGFDIRTGVRVSGIERTETGVRVGIEGADAVEADKVLVAIGRRPYTSGLGLEKVGVRTGPRGAVEVDGRYHTGVGNIYAIGDAIGGRLLAHEAEEEGVAAVENAAGGHGHVGYDAIASVVYTWPELAWVGLTERQLREQGRELRIGRFPFSANGRAKAMEEQEGFVKVIADAETDRLLGLHILGPRASDMIAEASLAMEFEATVEDIALTSHAHPTLPEAVREAALDAHGRAIHK